MLTEALFSAIAEAVFGYLLREADLADRARAALGLDPERRASRLHWRVPTLPSPASTPT
jgi:hypothetical protein